MKYLLIATCLLTSCTPYKVVTKRPNALRIDVQFFRDNKGKVLIYVPGEGGFWYKWSKPVKQK